MVVRLGKSETMVVRLGNNRLTISSKHSETMIV